ncbi:NB-ARC domain-containing protein [Kutzneria sp. NPDC052558]|uniref:NB-ARC domain-containing protein n=1 Tax=Kutzneria sp. NPDC052558 TaxID=3364121 RepID=UPI0037C7911D
MVDDSDVPGEAPMIVNSMIGLADSVVQAGTIMGGLHIHNHFASVPVPRELPADVNSFVGRGDELGELDELLAAAEGVHYRSPAVVAVVSGTAGVGKTALVSHWAHRHSDRFPDGQLYVNLRGYEPGSPLGAVHAQAELLRSLGVPDRGLPKGMDARARCLRSLMAGRRMLVVLDNANSDEQVRPLLPGVPSGLVLITSRDSLTGLVSRDGAQRIGLGLLAREQAVKLLRMLVGPRVDWEPAAADQLIDHCARLPLALRIVADLAVSNHDAPLAELVGELADEQHRLDLLNAGSDPWTAVRTVFSWSYRGLTDVEARVFRLLGLHSGRAYTLTGVATLADIEPMEAARALRALVRAHLIERAGNRRFRMHDLLRVYALELALAAGELA